MNKKYVILAGLIGSLFVFYFLTSNNSEVSAQESQCINRPTTNPPNELIIVQQVASEFPEYLQNSCQTSGGTWQFMDEVVNRLRAQDPRWAYNCKRGNCSDPSHDAIAYYYGPAPVPPSGIRAYEVFIIDIIDSHCGSNPRPSWTDQTQITINAGTKGGYLYPRTGGGSLPSASYCTTSSDGGSGGQPPGPLLPGLNPPVQDFGKLVEEIFKWALRLVGLAVFVNFLWAGFLWFTAAGRTGQISQAKEKMTNSLIGAIILLASFLILKTINPDLVRGTFKLPGIRQTTTTGPPFSGGNGNNQTCITISSNYAYTPPSNCELPYKRGALEKNEVYLYAECRDALWMIRNTNDALDCSQDFVFRGIPASVWRGWKNNEAQKVLDACQDVCSPGVDCDRFPASVDKDKILAALEPYWNLCIEGQRKGISCVCNPNDSVCRQPINFTALIQRQCP